MPPVPELLELELTLVGPLPPPPLPPSPPPLELDDDVPPVSVHDPAAAAATEIAREAASQRCAIMGRWYHGVIGVKG
jgi:hypothetical protein